MYRFNYKLNPKTFLNLLITISIALTILLIANFSLGPKYVIASQNKSADPNKKTNQKEDPKKAQKIPRPDHKHPAFKERLEQRRDMVSWQIIDRGINDTNVINSMVTVPRHAFVRNRDLRRAYQERN